MTVRDLIRHHEGLRLEVYRCPAGALTVGYGHNIEANGLNISLEMAERLLTQDLNRATAGAARLVDNFLDLDLVRQAVVTSMVFQMGEGGVRKFRKTIKAIEAGDFGMAAAEMLDSEWASQTPDRAKDLSRMMLSGDWPE